MNSPNKEVNYLMHLLTCALNEAVPESSTDEMDYSALLELAKKHQVYNIICPLIADMEAVSDEEKQNWQNYNFSEIKRMIVIGNERAAIYNQLTQAGIRFMPLKGLLLKKYYPKESMRQMSDHDILYDVQKRDVLDKIMKSNGYKPIATGENSDDYFKAPYCTFEFHRKLFFEESDFCPHFDNLWDNAKADSENPLMYHMNLNDIYVYSVCHMYKHFSTAGCGIRFLADIYLFLKKEYDNLDWDYIVDCLKQYGVFEYERQSRELALKIFADKPLTDEEMNLFETYLNFGIYGNGMIKLTKDINKLADGDKIEAAKRKYIFKRLFPSKKKMIADNRVLEKKPYLLPAFYVLRLFRALFNLKSTVNEFKAVNKVEKDD